MLIDAVPAFIFANLQFLRRLMHFASIWTIIEIFQELGRGWAVILLVVTAHFIYFINPTVFLLLIIPVRWYCPYLYNYWWSQAEPGNQLFSLPTCISSSVILLCRPRSCCWRAVFSPLRAVICCWMRLFSAFWKLKCLFLRRRNITFPPRYARASSISFFSRPRSS